METDRKEQVGNVASEKRVSAGCCTLPLVQEHGFPRTAPELVDVSIVTVSYNSADCIAGCVESVLAQRGVEWEMCVVDNASQDATLEQVKPFAGRVQVIANQENVGFGVANNQAARLARGRWLYLLNPDAALVQLDALATLVSRMEQNPGWAVCGTRVEGEARLPMEATYPGERYLRHRLPTLPGEVAWILGASMFFRKAAFDAVGGFDEGFFLYAEETDLCLRLRKAGHAIGMVPEVGIRHVGGASNRSIPGYEVWTRRMTGLARFYRQHYAANDVARLWRRDLHRARFRLFWLKLAPKSLRNAERVAKYSAVRDVALQELVA